MALKIPTGSRKIFLGILIMAVGVSVDAIAKNGLTNNLLSLLQFISAGFFLGNGVEHIAGALKRKSDVESSGLDGAYLDSRLQAIDEKMETTQKAVTVIANIASGKTPDGQSNR